MRRGTGSQSKGSRQETEAKAGSSRRSWLSCQGSLGPWGQEQERFTPASAPPEELRDEVRVRAGSGGGQEVIAKLSLAQRGQQHCDASPLAS